MAYDAKLAEIRRFVEMAAPFAEKHSKPAYRFRSDLEVDLFNYCPDFCFECQVLAANRVSSALELAYGWLGQTAPRMALHLRDVRQAWMGLNVDPYWAADCELDPIRSDLSQVESCEVCGVLLDGYVDPASADADGEWCYWQQRVDDGEVELDEEDLAHLYYLLHECSIFNQESQATCDRAVELIRQFKLPALAEVG